jgi:membrane protein DedA with SNARE-associated domain
VSVLESYLTLIPPVAVYLIVGLVVGIESLGVPLPGEIVLVGSALLASRHELDVFPVWIAVAATTGAVVGDSIGYALGRHFGMDLFAWAGRKLPRHFGPAHVAAAERLFARWGVLAVFFGRFVALLRIFAGPLAGALRVPYRKFFPANLAGAICWGTGTTFVVYYVGIAAERWLQEFSWIALALVLVGGLAVGFVMRRRAARLVRDDAA